MIEIANAGCEMLEEGQATETKFGERVSEWRWELSNGMFVREVRVDGEVQEPGVIGDLELPGMENYEVGQQVYLVAREELVDGVKRMLDQEDVIVTTTPGGAEWIKHLNILEELDEAGSLLSVVVPADEQDSEAYASMVCMRFPEAKRLEMKRRRIQQRQVREGFGFWMKGDDNELARALLDELTYDADGIRPVSLNGALWFWEDTHWAKADEAKLQRQVLSWSGEECGDKSLSVTVPKAKSVIEFAKVLASRKSWLVSDESLGLSLSNGFVSVKNGRLVRDENRPHHGQRTTVDEAFVESAEPVKFLEFLREIFGPLEDCEDVIGCVQEFLGTCLLGDAVRYQQAMIFYGVGCNGKSTLLDIARKLFPKNMVSAVEPSQFTNSSTRQYFKHNLQGSRINIVAEGEAAKLGQSSCMKGLIAGDLLNSRGMRENVKEFQPRAGHLLSFNELPHVKDNSHGFWRRWIVVPFKYTVPDSDRNPHLADEILTERAEILSWALEGAARVQARGRHSVPVSCQKALREWQLGVDPISTFVNECCVPTDFDHPSQGVGGSGLYEAYMRWCRENDVEPESSTKFGRQVGAMLPRKKHGTMYYQVTLQLSTGEVVEAPAA